MASVRILGKIESDRTVLNQPQQVVELSGLDSRERVTALLAHNSAWADADCGGDRGGRFMVFLGTQEEMRDSLRNFNRYLQKK
jgi:hypothetical protein